MLTISEVVFIVINLLNLINTSDHGTITVSVSWLCKIVVERVKESSCALEDTGDCSITHKDPLTLNTQRFHKRNLRQR